MPEGTQDSPKVPKGGWPLTLIRRGARVPDDGTRWWQELPDDQSAEELSSVGYEVVKVIPVFALLSDEAKAASERAVRYAAQTCNVCGVEYVEYEGPCKERCPGTAAIHSETLAAAALQAAIEQVGGGQGE